jgi:MYXO-CTERM domain-containing protein
MPAHRGCPRTARAFCRTTTVSVPPDFQPHGDQCFTEGAPLYWKNACVGYSLQKDASRQVSFEDASNAITLAFTKWTATSCATDGSGSSRVSIDVRDLGPVDCGTVQYNQDQPNQHVIAFRDDTWPHNDANNTLALTTVTFNPDTGEIYDADMEINTFMQHVTVTDPIPPEGYDFASIVTHETGHFLGMAHSGDPHATMFAHYQPGSTSLRNLTQDDITGICSIYRPDGTRAVVNGGTVEVDACDPTPRHGFTTQCAVPTKKSCGSSSVAGDRDPGSFAGYGGVALAAAVLAAVRRRRRRARRRA